MQKCLVCRLAAIISALGAINWGLVSILNYNFIGNILGVGTLGARIIYGLVGGMGVVLLMSCFKPCVFCKK